MQRCVLVSVLLSSLASAARQDVECGFQLVGELLILPAAEQGGDSGWRLFVGESDPREAQRLELRSHAAATLSSGRVESFESAALGLGGARLHLANSAGETLDLGELQLTIRDGRVALRSFGADLNGRAVGSLALDDGDLRLDASGDFAWSANFELDHTLAQELGAPLHSRASLGALTLIGAVHAGSASASASSASPPPAALGAGPIGPDVVVSGVGLTISKLGSLNGVSSYSMTTVACNIGDANASWIDCLSGSNCNQHPVIGQQLYRLKTVAGATRFEQLGLSWLKHGFCADDAPGCGAPYLPNAGCDWLGMFATDTYSYALNGSQPGLGARSEVQPWTGVFPYPPVLAAGQTGDVLFKRLRVENSELDPALNSGARYWGEIVYITADEAQNAVRHNNYSTRELAVGSFFAGGWTMSFNAPTAPQRSGVETWAQVDPGVRVTVVDTPNDGRFLLGAKVTALGGGQHHYEYALLNMNSDRAGQQFAVPFPVGATCTNVGFHDVDRHSGEPYDSTDWTANATAGASVSWATATHAQNANANALRWGTTYNFRFDCDAAPTSGFVTLTLFKPGSPTSLTIATDVPSGPLCAATSYCTAGVTTSGCTPSMSLSGQPSATSGQPAVISASGVDGQRSGLMFVGLQPAALPWAPGSTSLLCIAPPIARVLPAQSSGGSAGQCDGSLSVDLNAYVQSTGGTILGQTVSAGFTCFAQAWFRDPPAPKGTNLSNALSLQFCP